LGIIQISRSVKYEHILSKIKMCFFIRNQIHTNQDEEL